MRGLVTLVGLAVVCVAAACGSAGTEYVYNQRDAGNSVDNALPWPGGDTGFDNPGGSAGASGTSGTSGTSGSSSGTSGSSSGASSSGGSSSGASSSGASSSGASSSGASSSGASSSGASSSGASSSGTSGSSTSGSSGTAAGGACGVCERNWTCNGFTDPWTTQSGKCVNTRTTTALRCDGKFDQGGSVGVGTWTSTPTKLTLVYPMLGGGTKTYDCF